MPPKKHRPPNRHDRNALGPIVTRLRKQQNLTREDLAGRAAGVGWQITEAIVKKIENGAREVTDIEIRLLAAALRVPPALLVTD